MGKFFGLQSDEGVRRVYVCSNKIIEILSICQSLLFLSSYFDKKNLTEAVSAVIIIFSIYFTG